jgi:hypothetical protein
MVRKDNENDVLKPGLMLLLVLLIAGFAIISNPYSNKHHKKSVACSALISATQSFITDNQNREISNVLKALSSKNDTFQETERRPELIDCRFDYLRSSRFRILEISNNSIQIFLPRNNVPGSSDSDLPVIC